MFSEIFYIAQGSDSVFQENPFWRHCSGYIAISSAVLDAQEKKHANTKYKQTIFPPTEVFFVHFWQSAKGIQLKHMFNV